MPSFALLQNAAFLPHHGRLERDPRQKMMIVNRLPNLTPDRRPILTPLSDGLGR
jgi:hypothetical protein